MALYSKKLHVRKAGVVSDIELYTTVGEVTSGGSQGYIALKDSAVPLYAKLGLISDQNASPLRIKKSGNTFAVLTKASMSGQVIDQYNYINGNQAALTNLGWAVSGGLSFSSGGGQLNGYIERVVPVTGNLVSLQISAELSFEAYGYDAYESAALEVLSYNSSGIVTSVYSTVPLETLTSVDEVINMPVGCVKVRIRGWHYYYGGTNYNFYPILRYHKFYYT
ncbi:hypothetical protein [Sporomusa sphaeroides]|uniref:Uncharacterized protein n=2 Tax=Sporomusa TaxID=2375 RepID=A0ABP2CAQ5_9FIRM|nr:hypothetical protein [Sporomusa sphaeroides]OLS54507.1 hypothetical protein SPSPH_42920 [Sporomusa sphaeroides DSM 2875]CVK21022.1 hypothetical protein SSPH_03699 [Sporomusa sphaeroides DSM 2875]SCM83190.1 hypothetical protein KL86SPO_70048 [uncultured Sporomusa sp.]